MATAAQRAALLAIPCPWCKAAPLEECTTGPPGRRQLITSLDGGCHDARWQKALGVAAAVVVEEEGRRRIVEPPAPEPEREPVSVGVAIADRPW